MLPNCPTLYASLEPCLLITSCGPGRRHDVLSTTWSVFTFGRLNLDLVIQVRRTRYSSSYTTWYNLNFDLSTCSRVAVRRKCLTVHWSHQTWNNNSLGPRIGKMVGPFPAFESDSELLLTRRTPIVVMWHILTGICQLKTVRQGSNRRQHECRWQLEWLSSLWWWWHNASLQKLYL